MPDFEGYEGPSRIIVRVEWDGVIHQCEKIITPEVAVFTIMNDQLTAAVDQVRSRLIRQRNEK